MFVAFTHFLPDSLLAENPNSTKDRDLLGSLGNCNVLFRGILDRVVSGQIWLVDVQKVNELGPTSSTPLTTMPHCLVLPEDSEELGTKSKNVHHGNIYDVLVGRGNVHHFCGSISCDGKDVPPTSLVYRY
jgi:hypothetical protein